MSKLKIAFFGTPEFASHSLEKLIDKGYHICGVITVPDRPSGRGHKSTPSPVKEKAIELIPDIPILQPESLKDKNFLEDLHALNADLFVVIAFRMLPREVWSMPQRGTFNLHASLLPNYRGAAPIQRAIMNGETTTGVTTFFLNEKIDEGMIILQEIVPIDPDDNGGSLHDKLMHIGAELVIRTIDLIEIGGCSGRPQIIPDEGIKYAHKIFKEDRLLYFCHKPAQEIHQQIKALDPYPAAIATMIKNKEESIEIKVFKSQIITDEDELNEQITNAKKGAATVTNKRLLVKCHHGVLEILEIQFPNKKRMTVKDYLLGHELNNNIKFL